MTADSPAATITPAATISSLDHLVLTVKSISESTKWYERNLGMKHESFTSASTPDIKRHSLIFGNQKINLHEAGKVGSPYSKVRLKRCTLPMEIHSGGVIMKIPLLNDKYSLNGEVGYEGTLLASAISVKGPDSSPSSQV
jgi:hypothetical protein